MKFMAKTSLSPSIGRYIGALLGGSAAVGAGDPPREIEQLDARTKAQERVMLGLRLDEPLQLAGLREALDPRGLARVEQLGLAERTEDTLALTARGRFLGGGVTAELLA